MTLQKHQLATLSNLFSPTLIHELIKFGYSERLYRILRDTMLLEQVAKKTLGELFEFGFGEINKKYPNEYVYKNAIAKNIVLGRHSLNTSFMINELQSANSKVDCVVVNGTLTVYEIKTEFDNFRRLDKQLADYKKVFEKINVITSYKHLDKLKYLEKEGVGLMEFKKNGAISRIFDSISHFDSLELGEVFNLLRRAEYLAVINKLHGHTPDVPNTKIYSACKELFCTLDKRLVYNEVVKQLKFRGENKTMKEFVLAVPNALKARAISGGYTKREQAKLIDLLDDEIGNLITKG